MSSSEHAFHERRSLDVVTEEFDDAGLRLRLYVVGDNTLSQRAIANARRMLREFLPSDTRLEIIDLEEDPQRGDEHRVLATPMLVRLGADPGQAVIGDLSRRELVLAALGFGTRE